MDTHLLPKDVCTIIYINGTIDVQNIKYFSVKKSGKIYIKCEKNDVLVIA